MLPLHPTHLRTRTYSNSLSILFQLPLQLVENIDAVFDDGVAPELALDFDCQHVDSTEGLMWWLGGFGFFAVVYNIIKTTKPEDKKPCVNRKMNMVIENPTVGPPASA